MMLGVSSVVLRVGVVVGVVVLAIVVVVVDTALVLDAIYKCQEKVENVIYLLCNSIGIMCINKEVNGKNMIVKYTGLYWKL